MPHHESWRDVYPAHTCVDQPILSCPACLKWTGDGFATVKSNPQCFPGINRNAAPQAIEYEESGYAVMVRVKLSMVGRGSADATTVAKLAHLRKARRLSLLAPPNGRPCGTNASRASVSLGLMACFSSRATCLVVNWKRFQRLPSSFVNPQFRSLACARQYSLDIGEENGLTCPPRRVQRHLIHLAHNMPKRRAALPRDDQRVVGSHDCQ
jgi:hypothetical protein